MGVLDGLGVQIDTAGMLNGAVYWGGWILLMVIIIGTLAMVYFFMQYKYKAEIFVRRNMGDDAAFSIGRVINDRIRIIKKHGIEKWKFFYSRKTIDPIKDVHILPGNKVKLFKVSSDRFVPVLFKCGNPSAFLEPLPHYVHELAMLDIRQGIEDYKNPSNWDKYGNAIVMMGVVVFCLVLVGVTIYFTYKYHAGALAQTDKLVNSLGNFNVIPGIPK